MSASQLLRILQTLPACAEDEIRDFNTDEQKESINRDSRCTNPFLSYEEDNQVNFWTNRPELESSTFGNEFTNSDEDVHSVAKTSGFRIDKPSVEYELPELVVCYKESDFRVKDICIDEGSISEEETISHHMDNNNNDVNGDDDDMIEANLGTELLKDEWLRSSTMACCYDYIPDNLSNNCEEKLNSSTNLEDDVSTEEVVSNSMISLQQDWTQTPLEFQVSSDLYDDNVNLHPLQGSKDKLKNTFNENKIAEGVTFHFGTIKTKDTNPCGTLNPKSIYKHPSHTDSVVNQQDVASGHKVAVKNHETRYVEGESSFSMAGVISELISCSRPMPFSGGTSTRSNSSANSSRSFAFPTLENEYTSSPARMGNEERKRLQKQRRWRKGLLCCKF